MEDRIRKYDDAQIQILLDEETALTDKINSFSIAYSGLKDVDSVLNLACIKLKLSLFYMDKKEKQIRKKKTLNDLVRKKCNEAIFIVEELLATNIDKDQKKTILESSQYKEATDLISLFLLKGGRYYFESNITDVKKVKLVSEVLARALRNWSNADDAYSDIFDTSRLSGFFRTIANFFLSVFDSDEGDDTPIGIEEGEEETLTSEKIKLPLSQAIYYLENEVLPGLSQELEDAPGNPDLQNQIKEIEEQISLLNRMSFFPRSTPVFPEKGYYTDSMTTFTEEGEPIINVRIPVTFKSGNRLDRIREMVKGEVARALCGKGVSEELDKEYEYLKDIDSGMMGSSRTPSMKMNVDKAFALLKITIPALRRIESSEELKKLIYIARTEGEKESERKIELFLLEDRKNIEKLP